MRNYGPLALMGLLTPLVLTLGVAMDIYIPSIPVMPEALNTSPASVQLTLSIFLFAFGVGQLVLGPVSDWLGRRAVVCGSYGLFIVGSLICAISTQISFFLLGRVIQALGACGTLLCGFAIVRDTLSGSDLTRSFSFLKGVMGVAPIAAPVLGAWLEICFDWRASFYALVLYGVLGLLLFGPFVSESLPVEKRRPFDRSLFRRYREILGMRNFRLHALICVAAQGILFGFFSLSPHLIIEELGFGPREFGLFFGLNAVAYLCSSFTGALLLKKYSGRTLIHSGCLILLGGGVLMAGSWFLWGLNIWSLMIPALTSSAGVALFMGPAAAAAIGPFAGFTGTATALLGCVECVGGSLIGNSLLDIPLDNHLTLSVNSLAMGLLVLICQLRTVRDHSF